MAKAPARSGKPVSRRPKAAAAKAKRPTKDRSKPQGIAPLSPEKLALARINVTTIGYLLLTAADRHPDSLALVFPDRALTYRQLVDGALRRAPTATWSAPWRMASYATDWRAVAPNFARYLGAAVLGPLAARSFSESAWAGGPWVVGAGVALAVVWLAALLVRRRPAAWFAAAWFGGLLAPVLPLTWQFNFYYAACALSGLWSSVILLAAPRDAGRSRGPHTSHPRNSPVGGVCRTSGGRESAP